MRFMAKAACFCTPLLWLGLLSSSALGFKTMSYKVSVTYGSGSVKLRTTPTLKVQRDKQTPDLNQTEAPAMRGDFLTLLGPNEIASSPPQPKNSRPDEAVRNAVAISAFVALSAWTVLTVDSGIARGWTLGEVRNFFLIRQLNRQ
jgi:hypothetical protein